MPIIRIPALLVILVTLWALPLLAQSSSASFRLQQSTLNGGGTTSVSRTGHNFRMTGSLGQESTIGTSSSWSYVLQSGFWSFAGSGLVPVLLIVVKNPTTPGDPDLSWTGNNPDYMVYRATDCSAVFAGGPLVTQPGQTWTDSAPPAAALVCYDVLATAPGPIAPPGGDFSPEPAVRPDIPKE